MVNRQQWTHSGSLLEVAALALTLATLVCILLLFTPRTASAETPPKADYQFQDTRSSSVGTPPALVDIGPGTNAFVNATVDGGASRRVLSFPQDNGVQLSPTTGVVSNGTYTIVALFKFDDLSGYRRIVDFKNGTSDSGLYLNNGKLEFYPSTSSTDLLAIPNNTYVQVVLTRDSSGTVVGYVDGVQQFSFSDTSNNAVIDTNNALRFFKDNESGGATTEDSAGSVARIRLYDTALSASAVGALDRIDPTTFTVNSAEDSQDNNTSDAKCDVNASAGEQCTLRAAIQQANATDGYETINFNIPTETSGSPNPACDQTTKVCTIRPSTSLPQIFTSLAIDGYTQGDGTPGTTADDATENTLANGTNAALKVELRGPGPTAEGPFGIGIAANNVTVRGLIINRWFNGVAMFDYTPPVRDAKIEGNFIGTDATGTQDLGNLRGVFLRGARFNTIGGTTPSARNLISGNDTYGVQLDGSIGNNTLVGNFIGTNAAGTAALGNDEGVSISSPGNVIGGTAAGERNVISGNSRYGVHIAGGTGDRTGNRILGNSIFDNGGLGINLQGGTEDANGVTRNDTGDGDTGPNRLQNYPVLSTATTSGGETTIEGTLNSTANDTLTLQFFSSPAVDPSGFGEGKTFIGGTNVTLDTQGNANFSFTPTTPLAAGQVVTATATSNFTNDTSEFSAAVTVEDNTPSDTTPPTLNTNNGVTPKNGATKVLRSTNVSATFSEPMDLDSLKASGVFTLKNTKTGATVPAASITLSSDGKTVTFDPSPSKLAKKTRHEVRIKGGNAGAADVAGNTMTTDAVWSFTTGRK